MTTVSVSTRPGVGTQVVANQLATFRGLDQPDPPTYTWPFESRATPGRTLAQLEQELLASAPPRSYPKLAGSGVKPDRMERDRETEALLEACILRGAAHMDSSVDLIRSRPTLGAIRESSKRKAILRERAIRTRSMLPREEREHTPLPATPASQPKPMGTCRWCSTWRPIVGDELCQPCSTSQTAIRVREHQERTTGHRAEALSGPIRVRVHRPEPAPVVEQPKPAASVRMQRQMGPDGKIRFVRV